MSAWHLTPPLTLLSLQSVFVPLLPTPFSDPESDTKPVQEGGATAANPHRPLSAHVTILLAPGVLYSVSACSYLSSRSDGWDRDRVPKSLLLSPAVGPPLLIPMYFQYQIIMTMIVRRDWVVSPGMVLAGGVGRVTGT